MNTQLLTVIIIAVVVLYVISNLQLSTGIQGNEDESKSEASLTILSNWLSMGSQENPVEVSTSGAPPVAASTTTSQVPIQQDKQSEILNTDSDSFDNSRSSLSSIDSPQQTDTPKSSPKPQQVINYPSSWGNPPSTNNQGSMVQLPNGYGFGSYELSEWIQTNIDREKQQTNQNNAIETEFNCMTLFTVIAMESGMLSDKIVENYSELLGSMSEPSFESIRSRFGEETIKQFMNDLHSSVGEDELFKIMKRIADEYQTSMCATVIQNRERESPPNVAYDDSIQETVALIVEDPNIPEDEKLNAVVSDFTTQFPDATREEIDEVIEIVASQGDNESTQETIAPNEEDTTVYEEEEIDAVVDALNAVAMFPNATSEDIAEVTEIVASQAYDESTQETAVPSVEDPNIPGDVDAVVDDFVAKFPNATSEDIAEVTEIVTSQGDDESTQETAVPSDEDPIISADVDAVVDDFIAKFPDATSEDVDEVIEIVTSQGDDESTEQMAKMIRDKLVTSQNEDPLESQSDEEPTIYEDVDAVVDDFIAKFPDATSEEIEEVTEIVTSQGDDKSTQESTDSQTILPTAPENTTVQTDIVALSDSDLEANYTADQPSPSEDSGTTDFFNMPQTDGKQAVDAFSDVFAGIMSQLL